MSKFLILLSVLASGVAVPAYADDASWTGPYVGGSLTVASGSAMWSDIVVPSDTGQNLSGEFTRQNITGVGGGVQVGYQKQMQHLVVGLEGRLGYGDVNGSNQCRGQYGDYSAACETRIKGTAGLVARLGLVPAGKVLLYVTGGLAVADLENTPAAETGPFSSTPGYQDNSKWRTGYVVGGGLEYPLDSHISLGLEYNYQDFGSYNVQFTGIAPVNDYNPDFSVTAKTHYSTAMVRVNCRF